MLGRKTYTQEELDAATRTIERQLSTWRALAAAVGASGDEDARAALEAFAPGYFNDLVVALDRPFVHRVRTVAGKGTNPLNELELLADSLMTNDGVLRTGTVVRYEQDAAVVGLADGERIALDEDAYDRLAHAVVEQLSAIPA
jgi:hypothetical protein